MKSPIGEAGKGMSTGNPLGLYQKYKFASAPATLLKTQETRHHPGHRNPYPAGRDNRCPDLLVPNPRHWQRRRGGLD